MAELDNYELMEDFIKAWVHTSVEHPEVTLGEWLKTLSIMSGLAMKMAELSEDQVGEAISDMATLVVNTYEQADVHMTVSTLQ